jgi:hypothetical protein
VGAVGWAGGGAWACGSWGGGLGGLGVAFFFFFFFELIDYTRSETNMPTIGDKGEGHTGNLLRSRYAVLVLDG